jgi:ABC-2 type transport system permease protein
VEEIANPERLQIGSLDYSFVLLFLMPMALLILVFNLQSQESEQGFLPLIEVQSTARIPWVLVRLSFYVFLVALSLIVLMVYGAFLTGVFASSGSVFKSVLVLSLFYLFFWAIIYALIITGGKTTPGNTLRMLGLYLFFTFIIPGAVHQYVSISKPANLMTGFIDVRDQQQELYDLPDSAYRAELFKLYPDLISTPLYHDTARIQQAINESTPSLINELKKASILPIEEENHVRGKLLSSTFWFNPLSFFQNQLNSASQTHFNDYQVYRNELQKLIDHQINTLVNDVWNDLEIDEDSYQEYYSELRKIKE